MAEFHAKFFFIGIASTLPKFFLKEGFRLKLNFLIKMLRFQVKIFPGNKALQVTSELTQSKHWRTDCLLHAFYFNLSLGFGLFSEIF